MFRLVNQTSRFKQVLFDTICFSILIGMSTSLFKTPSEDPVAAFSQSFYQFLSFLAISAVASLIASRMKVVTLGTQLFDGQYSRQAVRPFWRSFWGWQLFATLAVAIFLGCRVTEFSIRELFDQDGFSSAQSLFLGMLNPDWSLLPTAIVKVIETIFIALIATLLAVPISFVLAFFAAKNIATNRIAFSLYVVLRTFFNLLRSVEPIIWVIIFAVWVGVGPFAGMLALMIQSIASLTKQYSELIESALPGPVESIEATGANRIQTIWYGIVPQVLLPYISFTIYRWDSNVRMATIIGFAGGGGIGTLLYQYSMRAQWAQVSCLILVIAAVVWTLDVASAYLREALK